MTVSFNLIEEPFIPCLRADGRAVDYGLRDVLLTAPEIAELRDGSPLVTVALHRLLLAVLHRCYRGPKHSAERVTLRQAGCFDAALVTEYFRTWADRFDLFHESFPFFQRAGFTTKEPSGSNRLGQELARGNNAALFDHTTDSPPPAVTPARAARTLIAEQCFAVGGGKSDTGNTTHAPLVSGAVVVVRGDTLFETLWLNLTLFDGDEKPVPCDPDDSPVWERPPAAPHQQSGRPRGYLDYLTWQSRTLRLHPEEVDGQVVVSRVSYAQGRKLETTTGFYDPMLAFSRRDEKDAIMPVRFNEFRDLWRDSAALFQVSERHQKFDRAPTCLHSLAAPQLREVLPRSARYRLSVFGLCTDKAKVNFWRHDSLPLPLAYLDKPELVETLKKAISLAEQVAEVLLAAVRDAAATTLKPSKDETRLSKPERDVIKRAVKALGAERLFWSRLEEPFRWCLQELSGEEDTHRLTVVQQWFTDTLEPSARDAYRRTAGEMEDSSRALRAAVSGAAVLRRGLARIAAELHIDRKVPQQETANAGN